MFQCSAIAKGLSVPFSSHMQWGHQALFDSDPNCLNKCYSRSSAAQCTQFNKWLQVIQIKLLFKSLCAAKGSHYFRMNQYWVACVSAIMSPVRDQWFLVVRMYCWDVPAKSMAFLTSLDKLTVVSSRPYVGETGGKNWSNKSLKAWKPGMCFKFQLISIQYAREQWFTNPGKCVGLCMIVSYIYPSTVFQYSF